MEVAEFPLVASVDSADVLEVNVSVGVAEVEILVDEAVDDVEILVDDGVDVVETLDDVELAGDEVSVEVGDVGEVVRKLVEVARKLVEVARLDRSTWSFDGASVEGEPNGPWSVSVAVGLAVLELSIRLCMNC